MKLRERKMKVKLFFKFFESTLNIIFGHDNKVFKNVEVNS